MTSPLLALFARSLREDTRAKLTYIARGGVVGLVLFIGLAASLATLTGWSGAVGWHVFSTLIGLQTVCVTIAGVGFFASAITEEKEEQTLGLLRMTSLNPLAILLGKSTSRLCSVLLLLAAPAPFTVLAVTLGGVSLGQITAAYCTLGAYTFFLCNVALLASVIARNSTDAGACTGLGAALFFGASSLVHLGFRGLAWMQWAAASNGTALEDALWSITPIARLAEVLATGFSAGPIDVQVVSNLLLGIGCFLLAWLLFAPCCDRALESVAAGPARRRFLGLRLARPGRPWKDALAWKEFHYQTGGRLGLKLRIVGYGLLTIGSLIALSFVDPTNQFSLLNTWGMSAIPFIFSLDVAFLAARIFRLELNEQTFASIATLPADLRTIVWRKVRGCLLAASPGAVCMIVVTVPTLVMMLRLDDNVRGFSIGHQVSGWVGYLFLWILTAFLSLFLKRGALPLGYIFAQVGTVLFSILFMAVSMAVGLLRSGGISPLAGVFGYLFPIGSAVGHLIVCAVLLRRMFPKLEALVGQE